MGPLFHVAELNVRESGCSPNASRIDLRSLRGEATCLRLLGIGMLCSTIAAGIPPPPPRPRLRADG